MPTASVGTMSISASKPAARKNPSKISDRQTEISDPVFKVFKPWVFRNGVLNYDPLPRITYLSE